MFPPREALEYAAQAVDTLQGVQGNYFLSLPELRDWGENVLSDSAESRNAAWSVVPLLYSAHESSFISASYDWGESRSLVDADMGESQVLAKNYLN